MAGRQAFKLGPESYLIAEMVPFEESEPVQTWKRIIDGALTYRCPACKRTYESLPGLHGAVECRFCGSRAVEEAAT